MTILFAIDAWWTDRQEEVEETRILCALLADFDSTQESVQELRKFCEAQIALISQLLQASAGTLAQIPICESRDHSSLLRNDRFVGMLATELSSQSTLLRWYAKLEREIE